MTGEKKEENVCGTHMSPRGGTKEECVQLQQGLGKPRLQNGTVRA